MKSVAPDSVVRNLLPRVRLLPVGGTNLHLTCSSSSNPPSSTSAELVQGKALPLFKPPPDPNKFSPRDLADGTSKEELEGFSEP